MALVSKTCLRAGLPDRGSEIHGLLAMCCRPLGAWLPVAELDDTGLSGVILINENDSTPTEEAWDLAQRFESVGTSVEELLFQKLVELLDKQPTSIANHYYATIREFVVRHPIATSDELHALGRDLNAAIWACVQQFYEPVPESWATSEGVPVCFHCGNAMKSRDGVLNCRSQSCSRTNSTSVERHTPVLNLSRVSRAIHQYWVEPGIDEMRLYDALRATGKDAELYPHRDRVDISVGEYGLDLKSYASPELLGQKIRVSKGGLAFYPRQRLVIPDWLADMTPGYTERVTFAMGETARSVYCVRASEVFKEIVGA